MGKSKKDVTAEAKPKPDIAAAEAAVDEEMQTVQKNIDIQSRSLQHLKTIRTGKTKILEILRQSGDTLDKKMLEALHERFNDFVRQEAEILVILKTVTGFDSGTAAPATLEKAPQPAPNAVDAAKTSADVRELVLQIAETNARLAEAEKRNVKLEKEAASKSLQGTTDERDSLRKQIRDIQEENVQKKQAVLKLLSVLRENPNLLKKQEAQEEKVTTAVLEAASSTPGTSTEYDEIVRHLDSIKQRRTRMTAIRERLTQTQMDDTYQAALKRLEALSTIRQTLEEATTSPEEAASTPSGEAGKPTSSTTSVQLVREATDENDELLDEVRREFISTLGSTAPAQPRPSCNKLTHSPASSCTSCDKILPRLTAIEDQLATQGHRLTMLVDQINLLVSVLSGGVSGYVEPVHLPVTKAYNHHHHQTSPAPTPEHSLPGATPETMHALSGILSDLAAGNASSNASFDSVLRDVMSEGDQKVDGLDEEAKKAVALSQLNSARGKFEKQRTLERIQNFASSGGTSFEITGEDVASSVEKDICLIIEHVVPWLNKHDDEVITPELATELRRLVVNQSNRVCFPEGLNSDLFITQLATIIDDTIMQFSGNTFKSTHHLIIPEISEILYNELAFFKLIHNLDNFNVIEEA
uniref:PCM1_C domain-containing protein n=1 Tax=Panagrellus redivivus TaxID=6233 RepID=A0A7E4UYU5_PANRE